MKGSRVREGRPCDIGDRHQTASIRRGAGAVNGRIESTDGIRLLRHPGELLVVSARRTSPRRREKTGPYCSPVDHANLILDLKCAVSSGAKTRAVGCPPRNPGRREKTLAEKNVGRGSRRGPRPLAPPPLLARTKNNRPFTAESIFGGRRGGRRHFRPPQGAKDTVACKRSAGYTFTASKGRSPSQFQIRSLPPTLFFLRPTPAVAASLPASLTVNKFRANGPPRQTPGRRRRNFSGCEPGPTQWNPPKSIDAYEKRPPRAWAHCNEAGRRAPWGRLFLPRV